MSCKNKWLKSTEFQLCGDFAVYNVTGTEILVSYTDDHIYLFDNEIMKLEIIYIATEDDTIIEPLKV